MPRGSREGPGKRAFFGRRSLCSAAEQDLRVPWGVSGIDGSGPSRGGAADGVRATLMAMLRPSVLMTTTPCPRAVGHRPLGEGEKAGARANKQMNSIRITLPYRGGLR
jgi:hypothetical protein